jgi:hypothetical protein
MPFCPASHWPPLAASPMSSFGDTMKGTAKEQGSPISRLRHRGKGSNFDIKVPCESLRDTYFAKKGVNVLNKTNFFLPGIISIITALAATIVAIDVHPGDMSIFVKHPTFWEVLFSRFFWYLFPCAVSSYITAFFVWKRRQILT